MLRYAVLLSAFVLPCAFAAAPDPALVHARTLLKSAILIDGHNDLPWEIREDPKTPMDLEGYDLRGHAPNETDIPRLKQGQVRGQFWSVFVPGELKEGFARTQLEQLDLARRMIARYPEAMELALTAADVRRIAAKGKVASLIGMEGGHVIENSLGALRTYYDLGARYMTLTHNVTLDWADAALGEPRHHGLTPFGKEVVREMNRLGMLADISHVSADVMRQVLDVSAAPVIFSHSSAFALVDHPRNVPDDVLRRMQANGGVVMVSFVPPFVNTANRAWHVELDKQVKAAPPGTDPKQIVEAFTRQHGPEPQATLKDVADHIDYVAKVAGHDHIGVAGDYCAGAVPVGLEDVSKYPDLFAELIRRGWSDADLKKLAGDNVLRAMAQAEQVARRLRKERPPSIATIGALDGQKSPGK